MRVCRWWVLHVRMSMTASCTALHPDVPGYADRCAAGCVMWRCCSQLSSVGCARKSILLERTNWWSTFSNILQGNIQEIFAEFHKHNRNSLTHDDFSINFIKISDLLHCKICNILSTFDEISQSPSYGLKVFRDWKIAKLCWFFQKSAMEKFRKFGVEEYPIPPPLAFYMSCSMPRKLFPYFHSANERERL